MLKVGLTVSASSPVAVISIALFRALSAFGVRDATILENNVVQTAGGGDARAAGRGYIIGPVIASLMCAGGVLSYLVFIPAIKFFGSAAPTAIPPGTIPIAEMSPADIQGA